MIITKIKPKEDFLSVGRFWNRLLLAGVGGAGVFLSFPTTDWAPLAWVILVAHLFAVRGTEQRDHFLLGWFAGTVTNLGGFYWITEFLREFGHMSFFPALLLTLLLCSYQGIVFALWLWLVFWVQKRLHMGMWFVAPICFVVVEFSIPFVFPWYFANSQYWVIPAIQICEIGGVTLLGFLMVMTNGFLFDALDAIKKDRTTAWRSLVLACTIVVLVLGYGWIRMVQVDRTASEAPHINIGLVEADVGIWEKEDPKKIENNLVTHQKLSIELERQGAELIVWPESAYHAPRTYARSKSLQDIRPYRPIPRDVVAIPRSDVPPPQEAKEDRFANVPLQDRFAPQRGFKTPLLFGAVTGIRNPGSDSVNHPGHDIFNTAILLDGEGGVLGLYDKMVLMVFGEYIPLGDLFPVFYEWSPESGDFTPGEKVEVFPFLDFSIGVMICYEDILPRFGQAIAKRRPNLFVNITNDAWFGKTSEPYLHMALGVFRAVEHRVGLVRSTNTGVSCFVDPTGRIIKQTGLTGAETLMAEMPMLQGRTLYQWLGDFPAYFSIGVLGVLVLFSLWRKRVKRD